MKIIEILILLYAICHLVYVIYITNKAYKELKEDLAKDEKFKNNTM